VSERGKLLTANRQSRRQVTSALILVGGVTIFGVSNMHHAAMAATTDRDVNQMTTTRSTIGADYAKAWSSKSPEAVASFYANDGQIVVNHGSPSVGYKAIAEMATGFYTAFPDLIVHCDVIRIAGHHALFAWTLEGRHAETINYVKVSGWEEWELDDRLKIKSSMGWFDAADYDAQIAGRHSAPK
jgi:D-serine deaminase-like pyridoxal phosphate-dependent protein